MQYRNVFQITYTMIKPDNICHIRYNNITLYITASRKSDFNYTFQKITAQNVISRAVLSGSYFCGDYIVYYYYIYR